MSFTTVLRRYAGRIRLSALVLLVLSILAIMASLPMDRLMNGLQSWIESLGFWGPLAFALIYIVTALLMVPGLIMTVASGTFFGLWLGLAVASAASTTTAALAFLIARYLARDRVERIARSRPKFQAVDRAVEEGGWKIVAMMRLSPALPFNLQNYLYGLTSVSFWPCVLASWGAMLPGTFLYVYIGHITGAAVGAGRERSSFEWAALAVGLLATVAVSVYVTRLARRKLRESEQDVVEETEEKPDQTPPSPTAAVLLSAAALLAAAAAIYLRLNPQILSNLLP